MMLSIVVISWNSLGMLQSCLRSLALVLSREDVELVWVDNGSTDGSSAWMAEHYGSAVRVELDRNYGVAYARNRGVERAHGDYILFLDDDTESSARAIDAMLDFLRAHPHVGICGVALRDAEGRLQDSFKRYPGIGVKVGHVLGGMFGIRKSVEAPRHVTEVEYLIGACQMIRRRVFEDVGLLDEHIFYGPEDADFCIRASERGWRVCYLPNISLTHHWRRSTRRNIFGRLGRAHIRALVYFYRKHARWW